MRAGIQAAIAAIEADLPPLAECPACGQTRPGNRLVETVMICTARHFGATLADMRGPRRSPALIAARAFATWGMRNLGRGMTYGAIARVLSRDRSSVINLHYRAVALRLSDSRFEAARHELARNMQPEEHHAH